MLLLKQTNRILPVYAADIPEICSALYELGGMTVMHNASGCSSTYTTHDEPRWYSMDGMVYISVPSELEAVMGDDEELVRDIMDAAPNLCPAFICIGGTPIPMMVGTDFKRIARMIENRAGIPTFGVTTNGMRSYVREAEGAPRWIVKRFCPPGVKVNRLAALKVSILGVTPLDFSLTRSTAKLKDFLRSHGTETVGCWTMESGLDKLRLAGLTDISLVVSAVGLPAAAELKEIYGMPWVVGAPVDRRTSGRLAECIQQVARTGENQSLFDDAGYVASWDANACIRPGLGLAGLSEDLSGRKILTIREQVIAGSLRCCLREEWGVNQVIVLCPVEREKALAPEGDIIDQDEDEAIHAIAESTVMVADPLYRQVCPAHRNIMFMDFPHEACSSRAYHSIMRPFICAPDDSV